MQRKQQRRGAHARRKAVTAYAPDLAYVHDAGFSDYALGASPWLLRTLRRQGIREGLIVDLGCGSGRLAQELNLAGYDCLGIDQSAAMLRMARKVAPKSRFRRSSVFDTDLPRCSAVLATGEILNYRFAAAHSTSAALRQLLRRVYAALAPGGAFIFDIATPERAPKDGPRIYWKEGPDWSIYACTTTASRDELIRSITVFRKVGDSYRRSEEVHRLRLYRAADVMNALEACGFQVTVAGSYGRFRIPPGMAVFVARRA